MTFFVDSIQPHQPIKAYTSFQSSRITIAMAAEPRSVEIPNHDQKIWLAYTSKITNQLVGGSALAPDDRVFICPPSKVFGGSADCAQEVFNRRIHDFANYLLKPDDSPYYYTSTDDYVRRLGR